MWRFNSYVIALQAAQAGQGIALGWLSLVKPLLRQKLLAPASAAEILAPQSFYLTWNSRKPLRRETEILRDWLLAQVD